MKPESGGANDGAFIFASALLVSNGSSTNVFAARESFNPAVGQTLEGVGDFASCYGRLKWRQTPETLRVELPIQPNPAGAYGAALKISLE